METDAEKLEAMHQVNQIWQQSAALPPGAQREKALRVAHKLASHVAEAYDMPMSGETAGDKALKYGLRAADYGAGIVRAGPLAAAEAIGGKEGKWKDVLTHAIDPREVPYTTNEVAKDVGIPEGGHLSDVLPGYADPASKHSNWQPERGGALDPTARGTGAFLADAFMSPAALKSLYGAVQNAIRGPLTAQQLQNMATDAANHSSPWANRAAGAVDFASDPLTYTARRTGKGMYDSAFTNADKLATDAGAGRVSDVLFDHNVWGGPDSVARQSKDLVSSLGDDVAAGIDAARQETPLATVPTPSLTERAQGNLEQAMEVGGQSEGARAASERLAKEMADAYGGREGLSIDELQKLKRSMQQGAADLKAYPPQSGAGNGTLSPNAPMTRAEARQLGGAYKDTARAARRGVEDLADEAVPGLGGEIYSKNSEISSLMEGQDALDRAAKQSPFTQSKIASTMTGAMVGGGGGLYYHDPYAAAAGAILGGAATSQTFRTGGGLALGKGAPWATNALRSYFDQKYNPWLREHQPFDK